jgi:hypothetical protein
MGTMNFIKIILYLVGVYLILGGLASFLKTLSILDIFGISLGLIPLIIGFYWDDLKNFNFKVMGCVLLFQWLILIYAFYNLRSFTIDDVAMATTGAMLVTVMTLVIWVRASRSGKKTPEYHVADSKFKMYDWWYDINSTNDSVEFRNSMSDNEHLLEMNLLLKQYINASELESEYQNSKSSINRTVQKTENKTIEGIEVGFVKSTGTNGAKTFLDYYFQKNGKYYSINIAGYTNPIIEIHNKRIDFTVDLIISTIN